MATLPFTSAATFSTSPATARRIVILGGGYAGLTAAQRLSQQHTGAAITLIDAKPAFEERIRLHQVAAGQQRPHYAYQAFLQPLGVQFIQARVLAIKPESMAVVVADEAGQQTTLGYDFLVYALGSVMDCAAVPGAQQYAYAFDSVAAAERLHAVLTSAREAQVLVVGGGLTGIETATELVESLPHVRVALATAEPLQAQRVAGGFSESAVQYLSQALAQRQVTVYSGSRVAELQDGVAIMADGRRVAFDICIWTSGFKPSRLAVQAGIHCNEGGQIVVDASLRSISHPNIIAVGDAASASSTAAGMCRMGSATALAMATAGARTVVALLRGKTPPEFRFVYLFRNICLGREDGVVQFVDRRDMPRDLIWTGAEAAVWKEYVCQFTLHTIGLTEAKSLPVLPPLRMMPQMLHGMRQYA